MNNNLNTRAYIRLLKSHIRQNIFSINNITMYSDLIKDPNILKIKYPNSNKNIFNIKTEGDYI